MKIAIKANPSRGKEIISLLKTLGGINSLDLEGCGVSSFYYIDDDNIIKYGWDVSSCKFRYTLEEFEKEFPFKVGDKVKYITSTGIIKEYCYVDNEPAYKVENMELGIIVTILVEMLEPYKEMNTRNVTLTLDKAKEWYKKGGDLKQVALQAFTEEELTKVDLPKTWEEFYEQYYFKHVLNNCLSAVSNNFAMRYVNKFEAFVKLQYLRDCWRQGWEPTEYDTGYGIFKYPKKHLIMSFSFISFLSFPTREMAEEFLKCFRDLIEKAGDLI